MIEEYTKKVKMTNEDAEKFYNNLPTNEKADEIVEALSNTIKSVIGEVPYTLVIECQDGSVATGCMSYPATVSTLKGIIQGMIQVGVDPRKLMMKLFPIELFLSLMLEDDESDSSLPN